MALFRLPVPFRIRERNIEPGVLRVGSEDLLDFLQGLARRFGEEHPNENGGGPIESKKAVEIVEAYIGPGDWSALSKDQVQTPIRGGGQRGAPGADGRRKDLGLVNPGDEANAGEEKGENEKHGDGGAHSIGVGRRVGEAIIRLGQRSLDAHGDAHAQQRRDQQLATGYTVNEEHEHAVPKLRQRTPDSLDHEWCGILQSQGLVQAGVIVLDHIGPGALREGLQPTGEKHAASPCGPGAQQLPPRAYASTLLVGDALADLGEFQFDQIGVGMIAIEVQTHENLAPFLDPTLLNQPARGLGQKPDASDENDRRHSLKRQGKAPGKVAGMMEGAAVSRPLRDHHPQPDHPLLH